MLKILYIGFGIKPFTAGGAINTQDSLMEGVAQKGHRATAFLSAPRYTVGNKPFLKTWYKNGIKFIELYNPACRPGYQNNPLTQCSHPVIETMTRKILAEEKPDIAHIHELQLHPVSIIDIISDAGIKSVKTIHNYYDVCPQRDLFYRGKERCVSFPSTKCCAECMAIKSKINIDRRIFLFQKIKQAVKRIVPNPLVEKYRAIRFPTKTQNNCSCNNDNVAPLYSSEQYHYRQRFFVERLNKLDVIHCSSFCSGKILSIAGVLKDKIRIFPPSSKKIDSIVAKPLRGNDYPISFCYAGGKAPHKGYDVLIKAFSKLDQSKAKLIICSNKKEKRPENLNLNIEMREGEINSGTFKDIDVGIVPSVWEEVFGLIGVEFLAAKIPVIGSKTGGIPDWLKDGENGFLFSVGDADQLAEKMNLFVKNPSLIPQFQKQIKPWKNFDEYVDETISLYEEIIAKR